MPIVQANTGAKVLVTGANGYVAMGVVQELLEQGFTVRGAVRSRIKGKQMKDIFSKYGDRFEWVVVEDITKEGAFDEAVKDVDAVEHTASPVPGHLPDEDPDGIYIKPAVQGTLSILNSIQKHGPNVKRVVMTSSLAALMRTVDGPTALDENDWGDEYVEIVGKRGKEASVSEKYFASKTLSERAAWDFYEKHKAEGGWDLVVINPSHPLLQDFRSLDEVTRSIQFWYEYMSLEQPEENLKMTCVYVDVRDIAAAHVEALKKQGAAGHRIIVSAGSTTWQDIKNFVFAHKPEYFASGILKRGIPELKAEALLTLNSTKAQNILGIKYKSFEETTLSTLAEFEKRGFFVTVFVTRANGYLAMWVTRLFSERGYAIRGTEDKDNYVKKYLDSIGLSDKFEAFIVNDIVNRHASTLLSNYGTTMSLQEIPGPRKRCQILRHRSTFVRRSGTCFDLLEYLNRAVEKLIAFQHTGGYIWEEWLAAGNALSPLRVSHKLSIGYPETLYSKPVSKILFDTSKEARILGIKYHSKLKTLRTS
ncbi:LOW QUALITY PROTEIN: hypothetical protein CVT25_002473 [Psilocybe cyanescens]|uniref:NAD-dependent epimerase/dehydratase domain-containing protein n=1 Tax=Psilocybe cyanescens TaxID=93625 RepID=A0A409VUI2_PSICY|nr:LOW QUALITY PROTEIN: hypothetical protein CVT25_002473 [Psilocybe cyanescens]